MNNNFAHLLGWNSVGSVQLSSRFQQHAVLLRWAAEAGDKLESPAINSNNKQSSYQADKHTRTITLPYIWKTGEAIQKIQRSIFFVLRYDERIHADT